MKLIPFLLGAIALVLAFLAGMFFCVRRKMRRNFARMEATTIFRAPGRINLKRLEPFKWDKVERAEQRIAAFRALGFAEVCGFTLGGMPTSRLFLLQHPVTGQIGIVQERDSVGTWSDAAFFDGDTSQPIYVSSVLNKAHFFLFPGDPKIHLPAATEAELLAAVGKAVANGTRSVRLTRDNAAALIEEAYATAVDARLLQPLEDFEIRRLLKEKRSECAGERSEEEFQRIKEQIPWAIANELRIACRDQFLREGTISAREWQQAKTQLFVVHDRTPLHELGARLDEVVFCLPELKKCLDASAKKTGTPRAKFAEVNAALPPWDRYKKLGEVSRPVPADIYCAPIQHQST
jgi:hypothetical protein